MHLHETQAQLHKKHESCPPWPWWWRPPHVMTRVIMALLKLRYQEEGRENQPHQCHQFPWANANKNESLGVFWNWAKQQDQGLACKAQRWSQECQCVSVNTADVQVLVGGFWGAKLNLRIIIKRKSFLHWLEGGPLCRDRQKANQTIGYQSISASRHWQPLQEMLVKRRSLLLLLLPWTISHNVDRCWKDLILSSNNVILLVVVNDTMKIFVVNNPLQLSYHGNGFFLYSKQLDWQEWISTNEAGGETIQFLIDLPHHNCWLVCWAICLLNLRSCCSIGPFSATVEDLTTHQSTPPIQVDGQWKAHISIPVDTQQTFDDMVACTEK